MMDDLILIVSIFGVAVVIIYLWLPSYFSKQLKKEYGELNSDGEFTIIFLVDNVRGMDHYKANLHSHRHIRLYDKAVLQQRNDSIYSSRQIDERFPINETEVYCAFG